MADRSIRCFIAVKLPAPVKKRLASVQLCLKKNGLKARWTDPSGFHLTLRFLGEVPPSDIDDIYRAMTAAASGVSSFGIRFGTLGVFPSFRRPRVIWAGIQSDAAPLRDLHSRLSRELGALEMMGKKQKFSPHVTLGRINNPAWGKDIEPVLSGVQVQAEFEVSQIHLYESMLTRSGAIHTIMYTTGLL